MAGLAPQRGLTAIGQNQNQKLLIFGPVAVAVIPAKARLGEAWAGIQYFFWIPGRVSLARNDNPIPGTVNPVLDTGPPAKPGVYLPAINTFG